MAKLKDKLWNWGHLEGPHNACTGLECNMTPEKFAQEYGIANSFIVSYGGNIQPPFEPFAKRFSVLKEVKWSVLGDASTPLPDAELGNTEDIIDTLDAGCNITGGIVDDFFSPKRLERFTPEVLAKIKKRLNSVGRDFWCVLYESQLDLELDKYLDCFDGVTFWFWGCDKLSSMEETLKKVYSIVKDKPLMLGVYLWDYAKGKKEMDAEMFEKQLSHYFGLLREKKIEGVVFCSSTIGDADLETNRILKSYIEKYGNDEIPD